jgi:hypothetical protein
MGEQAFHLQSVERLPHMQVAAQEVVTKALA